MTLNQRPSSAPSLYESEAARESSCFAALSASSRARVGRSWGHNEPKSASAAAFRDSAVAACGSVAASAVSGEHSDNPRTAAPAGLASLWVGGGSPKHSQHYHVATRPARRLLPSRGTATASGCPSGEARSEGRFWPSKNGRMMQRKPSHVGGPAHEA